jgi:hypothetical protein
MTASDAKSPVQKAVERFSPYPRGDPQAGSDIAQLPPFAFIRVHLRFQKTKPP